MDNPAIPKEIQFDGDWPWVVFKNPTKIGDYVLDLINEGGIAVSNDVGGLTLVATWVRTDSFIDERDLEDEA